MKGLRRAFSEFLAVPALMLAGFAALALGMLVLDRTDVARLDDLRATMTNLVFGDPEATATLLGTIAGALITITGLAFALLLLALSQSAAALTAVVFDQYMRRKSNRIYLGFFVGVALYSLVVLAATHGGFNPVLSATLALLLMIAALLLLAVIIYTTIDQMRPARIVEAIDEHIVAARQRQLELIGRMRTHARSAVAGVPVCSDNDGFVTRLDLDRCTAALEPHAGAEIVLKVAIGTYVGHGDLLAELHNADGDQLAEEVRCSIQLQPVRDLALDPAYGIDELVSIAWKSISTSAQSPAPGEAVIQALRDLLGRWATNDETPPPSGPQVAVVYEDDVLETLWDAIDSMAVVCSESMQSQNAAELVHGLAVVFERLLPEQQDRAAQAALRILSGLGDHVLTGALDRALDELAGALDLNHHEEAGAVRAARATLAESVGRLNSRATRVPTS